MYKRRSIQVLMANLEVHVSISLRQLPAGQEPECVGHQPEATFHALSVDTLDEWEEMRQRRRRIPRHECQRCTLAILR